MNSDSCIPIGDLIAYSHGGGWGKDQPFSDSRQVAVVRGADFPDIKKGTYSSLPVRYEKAALVEKIALRVGDIVLENSGGTSTRPTGRTILVTQEMLDAIDMPVIPASFCRILRFNNQCDSIFIYYWLQDMFLQGRTWGYQNRSTGLANFQFNVFKDAEKVPNLKVEMQKRIGSFLHSIDEKIIINNQLNDYLEQLALALYADKLEWKEDDLPKNWTLQPLSEFFPVRTGKKNANIATENGLYPFFTCNQKSLLTDNYSFDGSAILVAGNGDFNVKWYKGRFEAYQRTYVLIPNNPIFLGYLYCAVKRNLAQITSGSRGSVIKFITKSNIADHLIAVPPQAEQNTTIKQLNSLLQIIDASKRENMLLENLRDSVLPKLMSGEIDVSKIDVMQSANNHLLAA